jgi:fumarylacetoacetate (FAA) hydrolase family protein
VKDRGAAGKGFTHQHGDVVEIFTPLLGMLSNRVMATNKAEPWTFGISDLMRNLAGRNLI